MRGIPEVTGSEPNMFTGVVVVGRTGTAFFTLTSQPSGPECVSLTKSGVFPMAVVMTEVRIDPVEPGAVPTAQKLPSGLFWASHVSLFLFSVIALSPVVVMAQRNASRSAVALRMLPSHHTSV